MSQLANNSVLRNFLKWTDEVAGADDPVMSIGALQGEPGGPWPTQNFGWVGHNAFGPPNNWPVCLLIVSGKISLKSNIRSHNGLLWIMR